MGENVPLNVRYGTTKDELADIITKLQQRQFSEELDFVESKGGEKWLIEALAVNPKAGLNSSEIGPRTEYFGTNYIAPKPLPGFFELLWEALEDTTLRILLVCAVASIVIDVSTASADHRSTAWIEGFAIFMAVFIVSTVTAGNNYRQERQFRILNETADSRKLVDVLRDGKVDKQTSDHLVVGDIIKIYEGIDIPADGFVLEGHEVTTDESALTGEPDPIKKANYRECIEKRNIIISEGTRNTAGHHAVPSPIIYSGTKVLTGEGLFVVVVCGKLSCVGKIKDKTNEDAEATPLQQKLEAIADAIGKFGLYSAIVTLVILLIRFVVFNAGKTWEWSKLGDLLSYFILSITVLVVAIPEGLPLAVTLSLAYSVKKMLTDNNLVRRMEACETMGGANVICSDKTGTLTQNRMSLTTMWNEQLIELDLYANQLDLGKYCPSQCQDLLIQAMVCNGSATLVPPSGSKTEIALLEFMQKCGVEAPAVREKHLTGEYTKFPFSSARKRMSTVLEHVENGFPSKKRMHVKGASELVLESCTHYFSWADNQKKPITPEVKKAMVEGIEKMANRALRTIAAAYREVQGGEDFTTKDPKGVYDIEKKDLCLITLFGIKDILRKQVPDAIQKCHRAGIKVKMVTGDNKLTARAIAKECGIIEEGDQSALVMEGAEFYEKIGGVVCKKCKTITCDCPTRKEDADISKKELRVDTISNQEEFDKIYQNLCVLARSRPDDKYALVTGLREKGWVVAVTGDGTNDAPALKKADVGFAMGIAGTEVAREASSIILLDDNFDSIVKACMWGRNIYDSIRKFIQFQLTVNIVAVAITIIGSAFIEMAILSAIQMLWVNMIMDTLASLALATEPPTEDLLLRPPYKKDDFIVSKKMMKHILGQAVYQLVVMCFCSFVGEQFIPEDKEDLSIFIYQNPAKPGYVRSGRYYTIDGKVDYYDLFVLHGASRQFTFIFTTFVMMQVFNFINSRKLNDEVWVFGGIFNSPLFLIIVLVIFCLQALITEVTREVFDVHRQGLNWQQWLMALAFGAFGLIWGVVLKFLSEDKMCPAAGDKSSDPLKDHSAALSVKRSRNEKSLSRKFSLVHDVGKPSSLNKIHQMS